ncbi:hypothetical protein J2T03_001918 [Chryseobacterium lathyri]|nr:hypothetical protein [Chryseobacterium lathyri]
MVTLFVFKGKIHLYKVKNLFVPDVLVNKKVGGITIASPLQTIDYSYNIKG